VENYVSGAELQGLDGSKESPIEGVLERYLKSKRKTTKETSFLQDRNGAILGLVPHRNPQD
jgi:hypothetical protein